MIVDISLGRIGRDQGHVMIGVLRENLFERNPHRGDGKRVPCQRSTDAVGIEDGSLS
jgi:hypothetical protein